jgi:hypothetical protein
MLDKLKATQLAAKLGHAQRRLAALESEVAAGLYVGPEERYKDVAHVGRDFADVMRYLRSIESELEACVLAVEEES